MPEHYASLMNGKRSICWQCNEPMILTPLNLKMERPICDSCALGLGDTEEPMMTDKMRAFVERKTGTE